MKKVLFYILILCYSTMYAQTIEEAKKLYENKQYKNAIEIFQKFSDNSEAQYYLAKAYLNGNGIEKNVSKAFEYAKKSVNQNNSSGLNLLGTMYQYGDGVEKDGLQALMYYKQASNFGNTKSMSNIGNMYKLGKVVKQDFKIAEEWFNKALELGDYEGYLEIADMYFENKKYQDALEWYIQYESLKVSRSNEFYLKLYKRLYYILESLKYTKEYNSEKSILYGLKVCEYGDYSYSIYLINNTNYTKKFNYDIYKKINKYLKKYLLSLEKKYKNGDHQKGCLLAYEHIRNSRKNSDIFSNEKAFALSSKIINDKSIEDFKKYQCYLAQAESYEFGLFIAQDTKQAINYYMKYLNYQPKDNTNYYKQKIAKFFLTNNKYETAQEWYQKLYESTKDKRYLEVVQDYKKLLQLNIDTKNTITTIFPHIDTFKEKLSFNDIADNSHYLGLKTLDNKAIKIYDIKSFKLIKEFRTNLIDNNSEINKFVISENNKLYAFIFNKLESNIVVFDIARDIVQDVVNLKEFTSKDVKLQVSKDDKYLLIADFMELYVIDMKRENVISKFSHGKFSNYNLFFDFHKSNDSHVISVNNIEENKVSLFSLKEKKIIASYSYQNRIISIVDKIYHINNTNIEIKDLHNNTLKTITPQNLLTLGGNLSSDAKYMTYNDQGFIYLYNISKNKVEKKLKVPLRDTILQDNILYNVTKDNLVSYNIDTGETRKLLNKESLYTKIQVTNDVLMVSLNNKCLSLDLLDLKLNLQTKKCTKKTFDKYKLEYEEKALHIINKSTGVKEGQISNLLNKFNFLIENKYLLSYAGLYTMSGKHVGKIPLDSNNYFKDITIHNDIIYVQYKNSNLVKIYSLPKQNREYSQFDKILNKYDLKDFSFRNQYYNIFQKFYWKAKKEKNLNHLASLYIKNEKDWIIYTPEGLFTYGGNGKDLLKYHQNKGLYKEAKIIENDQLFDKFYRPDLIKKILAGEKVDIPLDVKAVIQNINPPELKILENKMLNEKDIALTYQICDAGNGIADPKLIINGQAINPPTSRGFSISKIDSKDDKCKVYNSKHTLSPGKNTISLKAYDKDKYIASQSEAIKVITDYKVEKEPNLYFLSIAVSDYEDDELDLKYPVEDVKAVKEKILQKSKSAYKDIYNFKLHNKQVTKENINKIFNDISKKIQKNDAFILYIAGHGVSKNGLYQFIPYDSSKKISISNIKDNISKIDNDKSLILLDTCQSGAALGSVDSEATTKRLSYDDNRNYIVASSSDQVALEGYKDHGVFTYSVLDAFNKNYKLKVWGLADHVSEVVPKITQEKFQYRQIPQAKLNKNFILVGGDN